MIRNCLLSLALLTLVWACDSPDTKLELPGLDQSVEVYRDSTGIQHIFAQNEHDLFYTQGYLAAQDRLFQFEIWRRQATGTLAELLGPRELERDRGVRLFKFRGDKSKELSHYHPRGEAIVDAFVAGVNQYIAEAREHPENLPIEFKMLDILPDFWTWEVVISRHQGLLENVQDELKISRAVRVLGEEKTKQLFYFHPNEPVLKIDESIPDELLFKDILAPYNAFRTTVKFKPEDVLPEFRREASESESLQALWEMEWKDNEKADAFAQGSNNWVLAGSKTESGFPYLANDPHRAQAVPSLRYWVHLNAPGWDVVGGGEPEIPGVSIGHNAYGAWGLTIYSTDMEDLKIYDLHPTNPNQYFHQGEWKNFEVIQDSILVKGEGFKQVTHRYTVHGPVTFIDEELRKVVAVQCAWLVPGSAPYLSSLSMGQATTWEEFRAACTRNHVPGENMVWAGKDGTIGWQASALTPIRRGFSGLVATKGDGSQEWDGFLPIENLPHQVNPSSGFIATANQHVAPRDYAYPEALGYEWADDFRGRRIAEVLSQDKKFSLAEMGTLQNDYLAIPARELLPYLLSLEFDHPKLDSLKDLLKDWDLRLEKNSIPAGIYVMWERKLRAEANTLFVPQAAQEWVGTLSLTRIIQWVKNPELIFSTHAQSARDQWIQKSFEEAIAELEVKLGPDPAQWQYGQQNYKHAQLKHALSDVVHPKFDSLFNLGPIARGGYSFTPGANAYGDNNTSGASFRILVDTGDWEKTQGINNPGQSGNPNSPWYRNLFEIWANDQYLTIPFQKEFIESKAAEKLLLESQSK